MVLAFTVAALPDNFLQDFDFTARGGEDGRGGGRGSPATTNKRNNGDGVGWKRQGDAASRDDAT